MIDDITRELSFTQAVNYLGVSRQMLYYLIDAKLLIGRQDGLTWFFSWEELIACKQSTAFLRETTNAKKRKWLYIPIELYCRVQASAELHERSFSAECLRLIDMGLNAQKEK